MPGLFVLQENTIIKIKKIPLLKTRKYLYENAENALIVVVIARNGIIMV